MKRSIDNRRIHVPPWSRTALLAAVIIAIGWSLGPKTARALAPQPPSGWQSTGSLHTARLDHTATLLDSGKVLVAGGVRTDSSPDELDSAELYDPTAGEWTETGRLLRPRAGHTATLLLDGRVLIAGGYHKNSDRPTRRAEIYDPVTEQWTAAPKMGRARLRHTATLLDDGTVLVVGGDALGTYQRFDPQTNTWSKAKPVREPFAPTDHTATRLGDGRVLVAGGFDLRGSRRVNIALLYDWNTDRWKPTDSLKEARAGHAAAFLAESGKVLVTGGFGASAPTKSTEQYDPDSGKWRSMGPLTSARAWFAMVNLVDGTVLATGGHYFLMPLDAAERFDPITNSWTAAGTMDVKRMRVTLTRLADDRVLVAAGATLPNYGGATGSAEIYIP